MTSFLRSPFSSATAAVLSLLPLVVVAAGPASAAKAATHTTISARVTASTVLIKSTATVSGTISPAGGSVVLERLVTNKWQAVAKHKVAHTGAYDFSVRAPKAAATLTLRVVRAASATTTAGTSASLHVHVVTQKFGVAATSVTSLVGPAATAVTGVVIPAVSGTVQVQLLEGTAWTTVATGGLVAGGAFSVSTSLAAGANKLRVVKPYTTSIAQGTSTTFSVSVTAPAVVAPPTVTTTALPAARVGVAYAALLSSSGGSGLDQWAGAGLPAGLTLSTAGLLAGTPTAQGTSSFIVTVTDAAGHSTSGSLSLSAAPAAGRLFSVGGNVHGQLGIGTTNDAHTFVPVLGMGSVIAASTGALFSLAVKADGTVWAWGENAANELGNGTTSPSTVPLQIASLSGVTAVAAGDETGYALKSDGTVWAWGDNSFGEIGDGSASPRSTPVQVGGLSSVVALSSTQNDAYALRSDGTVWAWGANGQGEIGDGTNTPRPSPVQVPGLTGIRQIASGDHSGYALRSDGTVAAWGGDDHDQLGDGAPATTSTTPVTVHNLAAVAQIAAGFDFAYALTATGTVLGWGHNDVDQFGGAGSDPSDPVTIPIGASPLAIAGSTASGYALLADHTVVGWGYNASGQLGDGATSSGQPATPMKGVTGVVALTAGGFAMSVLLIAN